MMKPKTQYLRFNVSLLKLELNLYIFVGLFKYSGKQYSYFICYTLT